MSSDKKILFQLSGSIAAYKSCVVISALVQRGFEVQTVASKAALNFVGAATLEGLTGRPVFSDLFQSGQMMGHIDWAQWADLAIVCPATANTINCLAAGIATDYIGSFFLAFDLKKPYLLAPAMNHQMYHHPTTQSAIQKLISFGVEILPVDKGHQACGDLGLGRLLDPEIILDAILKRMESKHSPKSDGVADLARGEVLR